MGALNVAAERVVVAISTGISLGRFPNVSRDAIQATVPLLRVENALASVSR